MISSLVAPYFSALRIWTFSPGSYMCVVELSIAI